MQMKLRLRLRLPILVALLVLGLAPARATDTHDYGRDEYAIIHNGMAPNKRLSLAAHGDGDGGSDNFHIWLMSEPAHRRIVALDNIGSDNNLDTGPNAYHAVWAPTSRYVVVNFRGDRHVLEANLYSIENSGARLISGPSLFRDVTGRNVGADDHLRRSATTITWNAPRRFLLRENRVFQTSDTGFARRLGRYGKVGDRLDDGRLMVEFAAEADCVLISGDRYRIVDLRVGKFGE
jgi:hypothetical protein